MIFGIEHYNGWVHQVRYPPQKLEELKFLAQVMHRQKERFLWSLRQKHHFRRALRRPGGAEESKTQNLGGLVQVIQEVSKSDFVIFIDDFHYIKPELREEIGKQIKAAAEAGVKIVTCSVPHRSNDVVRSNIELRGRVAAVDLAYWSLDELIQIPRKGFAALNCEIAPAVERDLAIESFGSPQLMQAICLNLCYTLDIRGSLEHQARIEISKAKMNDALLKTSTFTDFSKMVEQLHMGPRTRGTERKIHQFSDRSSGDVYRAILLAIKSAPAKLSLTYEDIIARVRAVCVGEPPAGSSINSALEQMNAIGEQLQPGSSPLAWDGDALDITDPYLIFFLRCSQKLSILGESQV